MAKWPKSIFAQLDELIDRYERVGGIGSPLGVRIYDHVIADLRKIQDSTVAEKEKFKQLEAEYGEAWHRAFMD